MTDREGQPQFVGQVLQTELPQVEGVAVAAAGIGGDQQPGGLGIGRLPHLPPPAPDRLDGTIGRVVIRPHADPAAVVRQLVDAIRDRLGLIRTPKVMQVHLHWLSIQRVITGAGNWNCPRE